MTSKTDSLALPPGVDISEDVADHQNICKKDRHQVLGGLLSTSGIFQSEFCMPYGRESA